MRKTHKKKSVRFCALEKIRERDSLEVAPAAATGFETGRRQNKQKLTCKFETLLLICTSRASANSINRLIAPVSMDYCTYFVSPLE